MPQKLLSVAIPSYNSQAYMSKAIESLLPPPGFESTVEILVVNDGSKDDTGRIADEYQRRYPDVVRALHQENGGHGDAVMTGLRNASGLYFKVVDSDDWADEQTYPEVLKTLRSFSGEHEPIDMLITNFVYDKVGVTHKHVMSYHRPFPRGEVFSWDDTKSFPLGEYLLMHSVIYRTQLLRDCGLNLPKHTFYVDELYVYNPLPFVERMFYLDVDFYHYFIGRDDQSVQEQVMIRRIDQALRVNKLLFDTVDLDTVKNKRRRQYMRNFLEIVTTVSSVLLTKSGTEENMRKRAELWDYIRSTRPNLYRELRHRFLGICIHLPGSFGRAVLLTGYKLSQKVVGFN